MNASSSAQDRIRDAAVRLFAERGVTTVNIRELAQAAGVARGTIYNNVESPDEIFGDVAARLANEMHERVVLSFDLIDDPAHRLSNGVRFFARRAHEEPHWGRFILRFAFSNASLQGMWAGPPAQDLKTGLDNGRYNFAPAQLTAVISMVAGAGLSAMFLVTEGHKSWREAGSDAAKLLLCSLGLSKAEAHDIAHRPLPPLPELK